MTVDEFIALVKTEPARSVAVNVRTLPPELLAPVTSGRRLRFDELVAATEHQVGEPTIIRHEHVLGPPATEATLDAWSRKHPKSPLPADLRTLLLRINGIHLWANSETGRSYEGLAPIEEWTLAQERWDYLDERYIGLSYHQDSSALVVVDVRSNTYFLEDVVGADQSCPIAHNAEELLDWLWKTRIPPSGEPAIEA